MIKMLLVAIAVLATACQKEEKTKVVYRDRPTQSLALPIAEPSGRASWCDGTLVNGDRVRHADIVFAKEFSPGTPALRLIMPPPPSLTFEGVKLVLLDYIDEGDNLDFLNQFPNLEQVYLGEELLDNRSAMAVVSGRIVQLSRNESFKVKFFVNREDQVFGIGPNRKVQSLANRCEVNRRFFLQNSAIDCGTIVFERNLNHSDTFVYDWTEKRWKNSGSLICSAN